MRKRRLAPDASERDPSVIVAGDDACFQLPHSGWAERARTNEQAETMNGVGTSLPGTIYIFSQYARPRHLLDGPWRAAVSLYAGRCPIFPAHPCSREHVVAARNTDFTSLRRAWYTCCRISGPCCATDASALPGELSSKRRGTLGGQPATGVVGVPMGTAEGWYYWGMVD